MLLHSWPRAVIHLDGDAFFASCEQAMHPEYKGRPVITGAERGIVAAASYEAKARGASRGTPLWEVKKLIPDAIILPSDYESYSLFSERMFSIMRRFTSIVEEYSIDEGFADISPMAAFSEAEELPNIARSMKSVVQRELGITVSVGLSLTKVLAKVGSKFHKPDGFTLITHETRDAYLAKTPMEKIWGIGPATSAYAKQFGMTTALDFARKDKAFIERHFAKPYQQIWYELNGQSVLPVTTEPKERYESISKTKTFTPPSSDPAFVFAQLLKNLENACIKARRHGLAARGLIAFLKTQEFRHHALQATLSRASAYPHDMTKILRALFADLFHARALYRATGVVLTELVPRSASQLSLFEPLVRLEKLEKVYAAVDALGERFGKHTVHLGASSLAHGRSQHTKTRALTTARKQRRLPGETRRLHLRIPLLMGSV